MYTIGQVSKIFNLPTSTLRYYDKMGLFHGVERKSGIRRFSQKEIETLRVIECLKKSGMEIKDIKTFLDWCEQGASTYPQRLDMFLKRRQVVEDEISRLNSVLEMINYKCWYYSRAIEDGGEQALSNMSPDDVPRELRAAYLRAHSPLE